MTYCNPLECYPVPACATALLFPTPAPAALRVLLENLHTGRVDELDLPAGADQLTLPAPLVHGHTYGLHGRAADPTDPRPTDLPTVPPAPEVQFEAWGDGVAGPCQLVILPA